MTDTDGILDLCKCGERPTVDKRGGHHKVYQIACQSCGAATEWVPQWEVMTAWNKIQRGIK
jgi:hypothetical protein